MKAIYYLSLCFLILCLASSCEDEAESQNLQGFIQFRYGITQRPGARVLDSLNSEPAAVVVSVKRGNTLIFDHLKLDLFSFGNGYVSESLQLTVGDYLLTEFLVVDADNQVIYAAPLGGSEQAQFVTQPLPIPFSIAEEGNTPVVPEVLRVTADQSPDSYGYVSFGFNVVNPYDSIPANMVQLKLDGIVWRATYIEQVIYNDSSNMFVLTGRKILQDGTYESLWIILTDYQLGAPATTGNIELQMNFNESESTGSSWDSDWHWGHPQIEQFSITEYDTLHGTISGTFSGEIYSPAEDKTKTITQGVFNKAKITIQ